MFKLIQILEEKESPFNGKITVVKTLEGTRLMVGGISQSGWLMKKVWNVALKKISKDRSDKPKTDSVLILGLGGGSIAELVQKYWPSAKITGVDIDPSMVELGKKYLGLGKINNLKIELIDANEFLKRSSLQESFNLVIVDIYKGIKVPKEFTTQEFVEKIFQVVSSGGVAVFNRLYSEVERKESDSFGRMVGAVFPVSTLVKPEANIIFIGYKQ